MQLKSISPSRIKTYLMCLYKYWMTYHSDIELKSNFGAANGTLIHDILENYALGTDTNWGSRLYEGYAGTLEVKNRFGRMEFLDSPLRWAKPADFAEVQPRCDGCPFNDDGHCKISREPLDKLTGCPKKLFEDSYKMTEAALEKYAPIFRDSKVIGAEYPINLPVGDTGIPLIGIIDLVIEGDEETVEIIDYKTGNWTQNLAECEQDIQTRIYSWAARRIFIEDEMNLGYKYKDVILTFDYFKSHPVTLAFTKEEDEYTGQYVEEMVRRIQETHRITRVIGQGSFNWKCKSLCDMGKCEENWQGAFEV